MISVLEAAKKHHLGQAITSTVSVGMMMEVAEANPYAWWPHDCQRWSGGRCDHRRHHVHTRRYFISTDPVAQYNDVVVDHRVSLCQIQRLSRVQRISFFESYTDQPCATEQDGTYDWYRTSVTSGDKSNYAVATRRRSLVFSKSTSFFFTVRSRGTGWYVPHIGSPRFVYWVRGDWCFGYDEASKAVSELKERSATWQHLLSPMGSQDLNERSISAELPSGIS